MKIADRHSPTRFKTYRETHETVMNQFMSRDFVGSTTLEFLPYAGGIRLVGEIACLGNIVFTVDKFLEILFCPYVLDDQALPDDTTIVQTCWYSYNASVRGFGNIFRYDNQDDDYLRSGHLDEHHRHIFNWKTGQEGENSPVWIGRQKWKTLGDVLQELETWYWRHHSQLPEADSYPQLGLRGHPPSLESLREVLSRNDSATKPPPARSYRYF